MFVDWMMAVLRFAAVASVCPRIVPRDEWGARPPKLVQEMANPVSTVVIHHTYSPTYCSNPQECNKAMQSMQNYHMDNRSWVDVGYSFAIGGDGRVYKGRGWNRVGAHAPPYNSDSIGITLIGDWTAEAPPKAMLDATEWLIKCGVERGHIAADYQIIGHRQARSTECPGDGLFNVIKGWDRWTATPAPPKHVTAASRDAHTEYMSSDVPPAAVQVQVQEEPSPAAKAGTYDPTTPDAERDAVEVRQLNKRSLWERLVQIWEKEAVRQAKMAERAQRASLQSGNS